MEIKKFLKNFIIGIKRVSIDLVCLFLILAGFFYFMPTEYFPEEAKIAFATLLMTKIILISVANIYFLISRKLMWSYIHFSTEEDWSNNLLIIVMYVALIWAFARGG